MHVAARSSSFSFKGKSASIQDIARRLNVGTIVEGNVRRNAGRLVIKPEMRDGVTGGLIWSQTYDRDENQILQIQEDLAQAVATGLQQTLAGIDAAGLMVGGTSNPKALDVYLRGLAMRLDTDSSEEAFRQKAGMFEQSIAVDPKFAIAKADLAMTIWGHAADSARKDPAYLQRLRERAKDIAEQAVALAPNSALGHDVLGYALDVTLPDSPDRKPSSHLRALWRLAIPASSAITRASRFGLAIPRLAWRRPSSPFRSVRCQLTTIMIW